MDDFVDAYAVLGVPPDATAQQLKDARRALVRRHHPDHAPPPERARATERVREVNVAYALVRNPEARTGYDRLRRLQAARQTADRLRDDTALAAQWEALSRAAGHWAGAWMRRTGGAEGLSRRAGRSVGRWLS